GPVRYGARERSGVGAADHPWRRHGAGPLWLHPRRLWMARRRRDLDQLPRDLGDQPRARGRLLSQRQLEEGANDGPRAALRRRTARGGGSDARARRGAQPGWLTAAIAL